MLHFLSKGDTVNKIKLLLKINTFTLVVSKVVTNEKLVSIEGYTTEEDYKVSKDTVSDYLMYLALILRNTKYILNI